MARFLFASHDGFGLGHVRRNTLVAHAILNRHPDAEIVLVTGLPMRPAWLGDPRISVVPVPPLIKDSAGTYRNRTLDFADAIAGREYVFAQAVRRLQPAVVVVDRHPYGVAGELLPGLDDAASNGAALVLGLRDVLDEPSVVARELAGPGWTDVAERFDSVLVYGDTVLCDHQVEYGLPVTPTYCGWVVEHPDRRPREPDRVVVSAGGGGDGGAVFRLGAQLAARRNRGSVVLVAGPYATHEVIDGLVGDRGGRGRVEVIADAAGCVDLFSGASAVVQMAGYNSTFEALAAGIRPVLVPRRTPRREQAIRAARLAGLGLADIVDEDAGVEEVLWLLQRDRLLAPGAVAEAGITLDGADRAAESILALVGVGVP